MPGISRRIGVATMALFGALLAAAPGTAPAAVTCELASGVLSVDLGASGDLTQVSVSGGNIVVFGTPSCAGATPTVNNTAVISIFNHPGFSSNSVVIETAGAFTPGPNPQDGSDNAGGTPEIEIFVNLNNASFSHLSVRAAGGNIRFGGFGINPNALDTEVQPDFDIIANNVNTFEGRGGTSPSSLPSTLGAQGGAGTGPPLSQGIELHGNNGADHLTGGDGADTFLSFDGSDTIVGGGGDDTVQPGLANDAIDGGAGSDTVDYSQFSAGFVAVDLGIAGPQNTGGSGNDSYANVENLVGTSGPDILRGDDGPNELMSFNGNDILEGRAGNDMLDAGNGEDRLDVRDGAPDSANCGAETDIVTADLPGIDALLNCETISFLTTATEPTKPGGPGTTDTTSPAVSGKRADPKRFEVDPKGKKETAVKSAKRGTTFKFRLSEAATVTFTTERKTSGRRVNGKCVQRTRSNARRRKCDLFRRVGAFRVAGVAGVNAKKFSGRIGKTTLKPGSYRALLTAVDAAGNRSQRARIGFTVLEPTPRRHRRNG